MKGSRYGDYGRAKKNVKFKKVTTKQYLHPSIIESIIEKCLYRVNRFGSPVPSVAPEACLCFSYLSALTERVLIFVL